jgi:putative intracellular protease/amidase
LGLGLSLVALTTFAWTEDDWVDLVRLADPAKSAVQGDWTKTSDGVVTKSATGSRLVLPARPAGEYDFRVAFTRRTGVHSVALFFVAGGKQASFEIDAWGEHLAGIQQIGEQDIRANGTRVANQTLQNGRRYTAEVRVRRDRIEVYLDDKQIATHRSDGSDLSLLDVWRLPDPQSLGIGAWDSETVFHRVEVRRVSGELALASAATPTNTSPPAKTGAPKPSAAPKRTASASGNAPRVLLVIANEHFFYREYAEPRQELERAGCIVEVAAGRRSPCRPHQGSGEGSDGGVVQPDLALADADPARYDAILFAGGWGSSMYQYAFQGTYANAAYNGDRAVKAAVNRLINAFIEQDKYVCALCHGVSVLAWARVNGRSPLNGKRATGPTLAGPPGNYPGRRDGPPPSRWNAESNGARMIAPNSIGNPSTPADDIVIDGKIITGQDDPSAREMGRQLARLLVADADRKK